jgi:hypothetical protein
MTIQERILEQFNRLLSEGQQILSQSGWDGKKYQRHPSDIDYQRFRTEALNIVKRACGEDSDHYSELKRVCENEKTCYNSYYFKECYGVLQASKNDFEGGWLFDLKALVAAELLGDFIDQAEMLFQQGYIHPAASLTGAVLEDTLRKLCVTKKIEIPEKTKIDRLNADLARAAVYDKLVQKRITALADIRNNSDHGHFDKYTAEDVEDMIKWVKRFSADYLH